MNLLFYIAGTVAVISTVMVITRLNAIHALLYLIISLLAVSLDFYLLGAPFSAALEVIIYAGAIMVLFIFVVMMLNLGPQSIQGQRQWLRPSMWFGPALLAGVLLVELVFVLKGADGTPPIHGVIGPHTLSRALFGPYVLGVELASFLLLAGLVGAYHLARPEKPVISQGDA